MSFKFNPEDFMLDHENGKAAAQKANELLQAHLATLPRVYGNKMGNWYEQQLSQKSTLSMTAILWGITEIEKKECEHEPTPNPNYFQGIQAKCANCGVKLKAKWEKA